MPCPDMVGTFTVAGWGLSLSPDWRLSLSLSGDFQLALDTPPHSAGVVNFSVREPVNFSIDNHSCRRSAGRTDGRGCAHYRWQH